MLREKKKTHIVYRRFIFNRSHFKDDSASQIIRLEGHRGRPEKIDHAVHFERIIKIGM